MQQICNNHAIQPQDHGHDARCSRFDEVIRLIGEDLAARLCDVVGGQDMKIPRSQTRFYPLDSLIGKEAAARIKDALGGLVVYIPQRRAATISRRNVEIVTAWRDGAKPSELSARFKLSERRVRDILAAAFA
ncbi:Mor transcription activator family protein [Laribacter hongkongensis]|uniref:Mor transcription activator family protein n=1 Tax=Laribacter hongkongensis TaxID=168471 RepID=UPI001EFC91E8|nr:Mor transcription activator family protein [Laribacter hongkongensis]MCG9040429.1 hypothetical protein [Laribacter hongkongensis]MCG9067083.1 hypothetical protein [Laribacter hongkongensis]